MTKTNFLRVKVTEITFLDGSAAPIQTPISLYEWKRAKKDGLLTQNAFSRMMKNGASKVEINERDLENAPFVAYRAAGGKLSREDFEKNVAFDMEVAAKIYAQLVQGGAAPKKV